MLQQAYYKGWFKCDSNFRFYLIVFYGCNIYCILFYKFYKLILKIVRKLCYHTRKSLAVDTFFFHFRTILLLENRHGNQNKLCYCVYRILYHFMHNILAIKLIDISMGTGSFVKGSSLFDVLCCTNAAGKNKIICNHELFIVWKL